jgi:arabinan endo-1,5-alpha-L-arabinosidase
VSPVPLQTVEQVSTNWPAGDAGVRLGDYMLRPHQKWTIAAAPNAGGYLGAPYFKITLAGTERTLTATADAEVKAAPTFTGAPEQLWRIEQLTDGSYRIQPKAVPGHPESLALTAVAMSTPSLAKFDVANDKGRWWLKTP